MLDLVKLGKVLALVDSSTPGEAAAAVETARRLLARDGKSFGDLGGLLLQPAPVPSPPAPPSPPPAPSTPRPDFHRRRPKPDHEADARSILTRYGSRDAVLAPCSREKLLRVAVARWAVPQEPPQERWTRALGEWTVRSLPRHMPPEIRQSVETAYSLPTSVSGAMAELDYWERRDREIAVMRQMDGDGSMPNDAPTHLDLPAYARAIVIRRLVEHGLRATNLQDALIRAEYWRAHGGRGTWMEAAILADIRHLASVDRATRPPEAGDLAPGQPTHFRTASERREEVMRLLSDTETAMLSDREIARRVGVSPQTVGNLRRRVG